MRWLWWVLFILAVGMVDFAVRVATEFDVSWVVRAEAVLFLGASVALGSLHRRWPPEARWQVRLQRVLVAAFALAGLRALLWALGVPIAWANRIVVIVAAILVALALVRSRRAGA